MMDIDTVSAEHTEPEYRAPRVKLTEPASVDRVKDRTVLHNLGYDAGFRAAADDYLTGNMQLGVFTGRKELAELEDHYAIGFEMGYLRKLAEILAY